MSKAKRKGPEIYCEVIVTRTDTGEVVGKGQVTSVGFTFPLAACPSVTEWEMFQSVSLWLLAEWGNGARSANLVGGYTLALEGVVDKYARLRVQAPELDPRFEKGMGREM